MNETIERIKELLTATEKTVSTAESITAGHLQTMLTSISGASDFFEGGITAYQRSVKVSVLDVNNELAKQHDCIHQEVAEQMAQGALELFHSDYSIATCGYAENEEDKPFAFIAIADKVRGVVFRARIDLDGDRTAAQQQAAEIALGHFLEILQD